MCASRRWARWCLFRVSRIGDEGWEDSAVPPEKLGDYLRAIKKLMDGYGYSTPLYGHYGQGIRIDGATRRSSIPAASSAASFRTNNSAAPCAQASA